MAQHQCLLTDNTKSKRLQNRMTAMYSLLHIRQLTAMYILHATNLTACKSTCLHDSWKGIMIVDLSVFSCLSKASFFLPVCMISDAFEYPTTQPGLSISKQLDLSRSLHSLAGYTTFGITTPLLDMLAASCSSTHQLLTHQTISGGTLTDILAFVPVWSCTDSQLSLQWWQS